MQVNSVSLNSVQNFNGHKKENKHQKMREISPEMQLEILDRLANASDKDLQKLALKEASLAVNDKKHKRIDKAIMYGALPLVGGLAAVVRNPSKAVSFGTRLGNITKFATAASSWIGSLLLMDGIFAAENKINKKSETARNFDKNHPFISLALTVGASIGAVALAIAGGTKLANKAIKAIKPKTAEKLTEAVGKIDKKLNGNRFLNSLSKATDKVPSSLKGLAKGIIDWAPMMMIIGQISHSFNHASVKNNVANAKYAELRAARDNAATVIDTIAKAQEEEIAEKIAEEQIAPEEA